MDPPSDGRPTRFLDRLCEVVTDLQPAARRAVDLRAGQPVRSCNHPDGHQLALSPSEALAVEACRDCPCCGGRLWISIPSVGVLLDTPVLADNAGLPELPIALTRRERQLLSVLRRTRYPLRQRQLAALVWSDPERTHDVRSALYRLRRKLRDTDWSVPFPAKGEGVRLVCRKQEDPARATIT